MNKQPTATKFTRAQESWAYFILDKLDVSISEREAALRAQGIPSEEWDQDETLMDLYDEELFYTRYAAEMSRQREHIRNTYLGGNE